MILNSKIIQKNKKWNKLLKSITQPLKRFQIGLSRREDASF